MVRALVASTLAVLALALLAAPTVAKETEVELDLAYASSLLFDAPWHGVHAACHKRDCVTWWNEQQSVLGGLNCRLRWHVTRLYYKTHDEEPRCRPRWAPAHATAREIR